MIKTKTWQVALSTLLTVGSFATVQPAYAAMTVDSNGGLEVFELDDSHYWFKLGGRLAVDKVWFNDDLMGGCISFPSGSQIRTGYVSLKGGVGLNWVYKFDIFLSDARGNPGNARFGEAFLAYNPCPQWWFAVGQVGIPFGLEAWTSSSVLPLMELSLPSDAFSPDNGIGLYVEYHGKNGAVAATVYHPAAGNREFGDIVTSTSVDQDGRTFESPPGSDPVGLATRINYAPIHNECRTFHTGFSARYENYHDMANYLNYYTRLELRSRQSPTLFTNIPPNSVDNHSVYGFELAYQQGPFIVQAEYMLADVTRADEYPSDDNRNPPGSQDYYGYYLMGSWVVTGESREYVVENGTFNKVKPKCKRGAVELVARYSYIHLLDDPRFSGRTENSCQPDFPKFIDEINSKFPTGNEYNDFVGNVHSTTLGATWWFNPNIRFMANYVHTSLPNGQPAVHAIGTRAQVTW